MLRVASSSMSHSTTVTFTPSSSDPEAVAAAKTAVEAYGDSLVADGVVDADVHVGRPRWFGRISSQVAVYSSAATKLPRVMVEGSRSPAAVVMGVRFGRTERLIAWSSR